MKWLVYLGFLVFCFPSILCAQNNIEVPIWTVGDKWVFDNTSKYIKNTGCIEVVNSDQDTYTVQFLDDICVAETWGFDTILFDKSTLNRIYTLSGNMRVDYNKGRRTQFNFPLSLGKQWKDGYSAVSAMKGVDPQPLDYYENYEILGWEEVEVKAGKFKAIKLAVTIGHKAKGQIPAFEATTHYWYSPDVKHYIKCQYDPFARNIFSDLFNWELTSFEVKK